MHRVICLTVTLLILLPLSVRVQAQDTCNSNERVALYTDYYNKKKPDAASQKEAYELAKQYLQKWPQCNDQYSQAVQKFIVAYEKAKTEFDMRNLAFGPTPNYPQAIELGKKLLASQPDDLNTLMTLAHVGYLSWSKGNAALSADAIGYARNTLQLIGSGKTPPNWSPFQTKDEALSVFNFELGELLFVANKDAAAAMPFYLSAATIDGPLKKKAISYGRLATVYEGQSQTVSQDYNTKYGGKSETEESKAALEKVNATVDRLIDYYARAVNLAGNDPALAAYKTPWNERLTELYKFRHEGKSDGLAALVANVISTPLPQP